MSIDLFRNIPINILCEKKTECSLKRKRKMIKRRPKNDVSDSSLTLSEEHIPVHTFEWPQSYSNDSAYSADDEDSDMETVNRLQAATAPTNQPPNTVTNSNFHSPLSTLISTSYSSSDSSPSTNIIQSSWPSSNRSSSSFKKICNRKPKKHDVIRNKFLYLKKFSRFSHKRKEHVKLLASRHKKSIHNNVKLLPQEQVINSLVLRVSAIKLSSQTVRSYQRFDANRVDEAEDCTQTLSNKIIKKRCLQRFKCKSVLQLR